MIVAQRSGKAKRDIAAYAHAGAERANNPPVGLLTPETDRDAGGWVEAVNRHGGFGRWSWAMSTSPGDVRNILARHAGGTA